MTGEITKEQWLDAIRAADEHYDVQEDNFTLLSPTFRCGHWRAGIEHQRKFRSVIVQWTGSGLLPTPPAGWLHCPPSDVDKGWHYRIYTSPELIEEILATMLGRPVAETLWHAALDERVQHALRDMPEERRKRLEQAPRLPTRRQVLTQVFDRNPDVVAEVLSHAAGVCQQCDRPAPFQRRTDGSPYLEVHHRVPLADGGEDTIENAIALCPNCHRQQHYG